MAKIMLFNVPAHGHVNVTLPIVHELVSRGHEVLYYCGEEMRDTIEKTGAIYKSCPDALPTSKDISEKAHNLVNISMMLVEASQTLIPYVVSEIEKEKPDVVIYDVVNLWARIATLITGTPSITTFPVAILDGVKGIFDIRTLLYVMATSIPKLPRLLWQHSKLTRQVGKDVWRPPLFPSRGQLNLVFLSREFQMDTPFIDDSFHFVGASINPELRTDTPLHLPDDGNPLVYVSLGTVNNTNLDFYRTVMQALDGYPATILLSIGTQLSIDDMGMIPDNFLVMNRVPQLQILQSADVFVTHGGMNSVQESLYYGVPMVVVPQQLEQAINGRWVQAVGAGIILNDKPPFGRVDATSLSRAVIDVMEQPDYQRQAKRQRDFSVNAGGYKCAVDKIEAFLKTC